MSNAEPVQSGDLSGYRNDFPVFRQTVIDDWNTRQPGLSTVGGLENSPCWIVKVVRGEVNDR